MRLLAGGGCDGDGGGGCGCGVGVGVCDGAIGFGGVGESGGGLAIKTPNCQAMSQ